MTQPFESGRKHPFEGVSRGHQGDLTYFFPLMHQPLDGPSEGNGVKLAMTAGLVFWPSRSLTQLTLFER